MTIEEYNKKYPLMVWEVSYYVPFMYHDSSELFLMEEEARAFLESLSDVIKNKRIQKVNDIWGFTERAKKGGFASTIEEREIKWKAFLNSRKAKK